MTAPHTVKRTTPDLNAPNRAYRGVRDTEGDATLAFKYNDDGCVIASRDAARVWHPITPCAERGAECRCVRI